MTSLFGMAGLAEAGEAAALMTGCCGLLFLGLLIAMSLYARSKEPAIVAIFLGFILTLMFRPWEAFRTIESDDPDVHAWVGDWQFFAYVWAVAMAVTITCSIRAFVLSAQPQKCGSEPNELAQFRSKTMRFRLWAAWLIALCLGFVLMAMLAK